MAFVWHLYGKTELLMCDNWGKALWIRILGSGRMKNALNLTTLQQCGTPIAKCRVYCRTYCRVYCRVYCCFVKC